MNILRHITSITNPQWIAVFSLCAVVFFTIQIPFNSSAQTRDSVLLIKPEIQSLDVTQIPEFAQKTRKLISDIQRETTADDNLMEISFGISEVLNLLNEKDTLLSDSLNRYRLDHYDKEERQLSLLNVRLEQWKTTIEDITRNGRKKDSIAVSMTKVWQVTLDTINAVRASKAEINVGRESSDDLKAEIINFIADIQKSQKNLGIYLDTVRHIQTEIAIAENKLGNISDLIELKRSYLKQNIWVIESAPIWEVKRDSNETSETYNFSDYIHSNWNIVKAFFKNNPKLPYYFAIFFLIIFGIILYLIPKAKELYDNFPEKFKEALIILKYPFLAALLITWFSPFIFSYFPKELVDLLALIMLLPLLFMLSKLIPDWKWYSVVLFSCAYLLFLFFNEFDYTYLPQRLFLIIVNILTLALFLFYKKHNRFEELNKTLYGILPFVYNLFIVIGSISLLASIFGAIQLAKLLVHASLGIILVIYVLETVISLVHNFLFLLLMGPLTKYSNILKEDSEFVLEKMNKLFRFIGFVSVLYSILELLNIRKETLNVVVNIINYPLVVGEMSISIGNLFAFFITIQIAVWISSFTRFVLEREVFPRTHLKQGIPNTILIMTKFTFVVLGVLLAFSAAGVKIDKLAIAMGALGVGIGFGLQNIISNFVSGIILALERPVTIGDIVDIPDVSGTVRDIGLRASTIRTWDGSDVIVPNAKLISDKLTNWTYFDKLRRVKVDVRVPFGSNIEEVSKLLIETAGKIPEVMKKPNPYLNFKGIGTSAMEINLYCWINDSDKIFSYGTAIRKAIYKALIDEGYDIPVPKQDLMLDSQIVLSNNMGKGQT